MGCEKSEPGRGILGPLILSKAKASYIYKDAPKVPLPGPTPPNP